LDGGWDRLLPDSREVWAIGQLGVDWRPLDWFGVHLQGVARSYHPGVTSKGGFTEGYIEATPQLGSTWTLRLRLGPQFPGTSQENIGPLWSSPYTVTLSALNSWVSEEVRPSGLSAVLQHTSPGGGEFEIGGMALRGNDTMGALLAWRGWALHDWLTSVGDLLPLPPLPSLAPGGPFGAQRSDGTSPLRELDGRLGWQGRAAWKWPGVVSVVGSHLDTRGDRGLHHGEYAWATSYDQVGATIEPGGGFTLLGEWLSGRTAMGPLIGTRVDARFRTAYGLASWEIGRLRVSARYDTFRVGGVDEASEYSDDDGHAVTGTVLVRLARHARLAFEAVKVDGNHPAAALSGDATRRGARSVSVELRLSF
jgi:hypothetical protein